jgi:hypothetical protein
MSRDQLLISRPYSKGAWAAGTDAVSDTQNSLVIPPGLYDVEVNASGFTGTVATIVVDCQEQGYLLTDPTHATVTWGQLLDARSRTWTNPGSATSARFFLRGVRVTRWWQGDTNGVSKNNAGNTVNMTGTTPGATKVQVTWWPQGRAVQFNGLP